MDKRTAFLMLVQTGAITYALVNGRAPDTAVAVLAYAMTIPEERIPVDVERAAMEYLHLQYSVSPPGPRINPPGWLVGFPPY
jgi:hypothetical protein